MSTRPGEAKAQQGKVVIQVFQGKEPVGMPQVISDKDAERRAELVEKRLQRPVVQVRRVIGGASQREDKLVEIDLVLGGIEAARARADALVARAKVATAYGAPNNGIIVHEYQSGIAMALRLRNELEDESARMARVNDAGKARRVPDGSLWLHGRKLRPIPGDTYH
ncbi:MAG TPA: hypothetical protein VL944_02330 [Candidatus Acidoferrum sp.]|nr:hypothetical protein [Candidatus Acidoferrum sp.]